MMALYGRNSAKPPMLQAHVKTPALAVTPVQLGLFPGNSQQHLSTGTAFGGRDEPFTQIAEQASNTIL